MPIRPLLLSAAIMGAVLSAAPATAAPSYHATSTPAAATTRTAHKANERSHVRRDLFGKGLPAAQVLFRGGFEVGDTGGPPLARDDAATLAEDAAATAIDVRANDLRSSSAVIASVSQPANGTVSIVGAGAQLSYQPNADFCGLAPDTIVYALAPGGSTATVAVTVECGAPPGPVAEADFATVHEDSGPVELDVIANDTGTDPQTHIDSVTQPANGDVAIVNAGARLTYAPHPGYCNTDPVAAPDTFMYTLTPGGSSATASVVVICAGAVQIVSNGGAPTASFTHPSGSTAPVTQVMAVSSEPGPIAYAIDGGADASDFDIDATSGELRYVMQDGQFPPDADGDLQYLVTVSASQGVVNDTQALAIQLIEGLTVTAKYVVVLRNGESTDLDVRVLDANGQLEPLAPVTIAIAPSGVVTAAGTAITAIGQPSDNAEFDATSPARAPWKGYVAVRDIIDIAPGDNQSNAISGTDGFSAFGSAAFSPSTSYHSDIYRVALPAGPVTITMDTGDDLDSYLILVDGRGLPVAVNDDDNTGALGVGSRIDFQVPEAGVYVIEASTYTPLGFGNYSLQVQAGP